MPRLVVLTGYPGSGKTYYANHNSDFENFVKFVDSDPLSINIFHTEKGLRGILMQLNAGRDCVIVDCSCCHSDARQFLDQLMESLSESQLVHAKVSVDYRYFEPKYEECKANILNSCERCQGLHKKGCPQCDPRIETLDCVREYYADHIPKGAPRIEVKQYVKVAS